MVFGEDYRDRLDRLEQWRERFAWFPVRLSDGRVLWLERYFERYSAKPWHGGTCVRSTRVWQRVKTPPQDRRITGSPLRGDDSESAALRGRYHHVHLAITALQSEVERLRDSLGEIERRPDKARELASSALWGSSDKPD